MASTACKSWKKENLLSTKVGVQSCPTAFKAAPEQYPLINYLIEVLELAWSSGVLEWNFRCHQPCSGFAIMRKYITQLKKMEFNEKVQVFSSIVFSLSHLKVINTVTDTVSFLATWPCWNFSSRYMTSQRIRQKHVVLWFARTCTAGTYQFSALPSLLPWSKRESAESRRPIL